MARKRSKSRKVIDYATRNTIYKFPFVRPTRIITRPITRRLFEPRRVHTQSRRDEPRTNRNIRRKPVRYITKRAVKRAATATIPGYREINKAMRIARCMNASDERRRQYFKSKKTGSKSSNNKRRKHKKCSV